MRTPAALPLFASGLLALQAGAEDTRPLTPVEAREQIGKEVTVRMQVKAAKDRLQKQGEIYLESEEDFRDEKNFAVVITQKGAASLKHAGIADPAGHFKRKTIIARGTVKEVDEVPRIEINEAKHIAAAEKEAKDGTKGGGCVSPAAPGVPDLAVTIPRARGQGGKKQES